MPTGLQAKRYVYVWADGIYLEARLEDEKQCILVLIGATPEGKKELVGFTDGARESAHDWRNLLLGLKRRGLQVSPELAIAVVPSARGKGVGTALHEALLREARAAGYPAISLSVDRTNAGAIELYERHGFERVAENEDSVTMLARLDTSTSQPTEGTETA